MTTHQILRRRLEERLNILYDRDKDLATETLNDLYKTEWSNTFETFMRNRLVMGALRYGKIHAKGKPTYDRVASIVKRINKYKETGNKELLVDVANLCLLEFEECQHPKAHFESIDDGEHVKVK